MKTETEIKVCGKRMKNIRSMERIDKICAHTLYQQCMREIEKAEEDRVYCRHGLSHSLDVARIAYIMVLEEGYSVKRDLVYAMALLHDMGRSVQYQTGEDHHTAGLPIAERILLDCGFAKEETDILIEAIGAHQELTEESGNAENPYTALLYRADKLSRNCFCCKAADSCYWKEEEKNSGILY